MVEYQAKMEVVLEECRKVSAGIYRDLGKGKQVVESADLFIGSLPNPVKRPEPEFQTPVQERSVRQEEQSQKKKVDERESSTPASRGFSQRTTGTPSMRNTLSASKTINLELVEKTSASKKKTVVERRGVRAGRRGDDVE